MANTTQHIKDFASINMLHLYSFNNSILSPYTHSLSIGELPKETPLLVPFYRFWNRLTTTRINLRQSNSTPDELVGKSRYRVLTKNTSIYLLKEWPLYKLKIKQRVIKLLNQKQTSGVGSRHLYG